jgi:hypothetical protein
LETFAQDDRGAASGLDPDLGDTLTRAAIELRQRAIDDVPDFEPEREIQSCRKILNVAGKLVATRVVVHRLLNQSGVRWALDGVLRSCRQGKQYNQSRISNAVHTPSPQL